MENENWDQGPGSPNDTTDWEAERAANLETGQIYRGSIKTHLLATITNRFRLTLCGKRTFLPRYGRADFPFFEIEEDYRQCYPIQARNVVTENPTCKLCAAGSMLPVSLNERERYEDVEGQKILAWCRE